MNTFIQTMAVTPGAPEIILCGIVIIIPLVIITCIIKFTKKSDSENKSAPPKIGNINELEKCRVCGGNVSVNAAACPHCGEPSGNE